MADALTGFTISNLCEPAGCLTSAIGPTGTFDFDGYTFNIVTPQATKIVYGNNGASQYLTLPTGRAIYLQQSNQTLLTGAFLPVPLKQSTSRIRRLKGISALPMSIPLCWIGMAFLLFHVRNGFPQCFELLCSSMTGIMTVVSHYKRVLWQLLSLGLLFWQQRVCSPSLFVMGLKK